MLRHAVLNTLAPKHFRIDDRGGVGVVVLDRVVRPMRQMAVDNARIVTRR